MAPGHYRRRIGTGGGEVWFDHQWGNFEASRLAWNWFALQLDDGSSVMLYQLFDKGRQRWRWLALTPARMGAACPWMKRR